MARLWHVTKHHTRDHLREPFAHAGFLGCARPHLVSGRVFSLASSVDVGWAALRTLVAGPFLAYQRKPHRAWEAPDAKVTPNLRLFPVARGRAMGEVGAVAGE